MTDIAELSDNVVKSIKTYIAQRFATMETSLADLVVRTVAALPKPADGAPGERGLQGERGIDGKDGAPGERGLQGERGIDGKDGAPGERGLQGERGIDGKDGAPGERGLQGERGIDGKSVTIDEVKPLLEGEVARWELEFERRAADLLQRAVDRIPRPKDGKDGFSPEDLDIESKDGGRVIVIRMRSATRDDVVREVRTGALVYRGVFKNGTPYQQGDAMTYGGSMWVAQKDDPGTPGDGAGWKLAVKKGGA